MLRGVEKHIEGCGGRKSFQKLLLEELSSDGNVHQHHFSWHENTSEALLILVSSGSNRLSSFLLILTFVLILC